MSKLPQTLPKFFFRYFKQYPISFTIFFLAPFALILEVTLMPYGLKMIVDAFTKFDGHRQDIWATVQSAIWLIGTAWISLIVIMRLQYGWQAFVIPKYQAKMRLDLLNYVSEHSFEFFLNRFAGNIANKISDLVRTVESMREIICWHIISSIAVTSASLIMLYLVSPLFCLIMLSWISIHILIVMTQAKKINRISSENAEDKSVLSGSIVDILTNIMPVKLFAHQEFELDSVGFKQRIEASSSKQLILKMNLFRLCIDIPVTIMLGFTIYYIVRYWSLGKISTGDVVFIFNITFAVMNQLWWMGHALAELFKEIGVANQALELLSRPHSIIDNPESKPLVVTKGRIEFDHVSFQYHENTQLFRDKKVVILPGEKVGLVGYSGAGKSTFVHLILRFFDLDGGRIMIDGQDISLVTQASLRQNIAFIPQDTTLFHRTIEENIRYGCLDATEKDVIDAAKQAHCHDFIISLEKGYSTLVGERGIKLSGGQRQRIAIARAILKKAPILILDEATSSLDSITESTVQSSLAALMRNATTIVVAHRLSTLAQMDRILVFEQGKIIEDGTHEQLIALQGHYYKLWQMQAGGFLPMDP
ncbi:ABC transporter ATP-binding protein [Legionella sp. W05-934-2]|uniref:ABC transporter ATP-binding protein n=1 Tax=Legionella sp. W05-934-2 TaxID=1198649 RepID=UPI003461CAD4